MNNPWDAPKRPPAWDEPRKHYASAAAFLSEAQELARADRVRWRKSHGTGHEITKDETIFVVLRASPGMRRPPEESRTIPDRWLVWGMVRRLPKEQRIVAAVTIFPDGLWLSISSGMDE